jgi:hypothetical protein
MSSYREAARRPMFVKCGGSVHHLDQVLEMETVTSGVVGFRYLQSEDGQRPLAG